MRTFAKVTQAMTPKAEAMKTGTENRTKPFYLLFLVCTAALGGLLFGFDIAIITGAGPYIREHFRLDELSLGWAFSSLLFGCILGSQAAGRLTDRFGRTRILLWVAALFAVTSVLTGAASSFFAFIVARCLGGLAVGGVSVVSPIYIAEVSPPERRGRFGALYQMSVVTGILLSYLTNYWLRNSGPENWRWMFVTGAVPAVFLAVLLLRAPETPRYLLKMGKSVDARNILAQIFSPERAEREWSSMRANVEKDRGGWKSLLRPGMRRVLLLSICLAILIHVSGVNTVIDYAPLIFQSAGWKIDAALLATFVVGIINFVFTMASWMIDRWGRKPLYIAGFCAMGIILASLSLLAFKGGFSG